MPPPPRTRPATPSLHTRDAGHAQARPKPHRTIVRTATAPASSARRRAAARPAEPQPLPGKAELRAFLAGATGRVSKSDIARHFGLTADQRPALRVLMKEIAAEGAAAPAGKRAIIHPARLPEIAPVEVTGTDPDGDPIARPLQWQAKAARRSSTCIRAPGQPALTAGERVLARLKPIGPGRV